MLQQTALDVSILACQSPWITDADGLVLPMF